MRTMAHVGMDVHKVETRVALLPEGEADFLDQCRLETSAKALREYLHRWADRFELRCYYEAGPLGYTPYRWLTQAGIACEMIAPTLTPRAPGDRRKTDVRDARVLARQARAGGLVAVHVPTPEEEALRTLVRYRAVCQQELLAAKHRVLKLLGVRGRYYLEGKQWTQAHWRWLRSQSLPETYAEWVLEQYRAEVCYRQERLTEADRQLVEVSQSAAYAGRVGRLCCFRGIAVLSALVILAETIDFGRFPSAPQYMDYWGLTCGEHSSGGVRRLLPITKCGSGFLRRIWVEAAWHYRHKPAVSEGLRRRQEGQPPEVIAHAWKAQLRLHQKYWRLATAKSPTIAVVAIARELAGFVWGAMRVGPNEEGR